MTTEVLPTGALRAWGWPLIAAGIALVVIVWPLFAIGAVTDHSDGQATLVLVASLAPWLGLMAIGSGIACVVVASKRAAANREAVQRAVLGI